VPGVSEVQALPLCVQAWKLRVSGVTREVVPNVCELSVSLSLPEDAV
jgi:hypothetical protein